MLFPSLYEIATQKNMTFITELDGAKWIQALQNITTAIQPERFVVMWRMLQEVQHLPQPDTIDW